MKLVDEYNAINEADVAKLVFHNVKSKIEPLVDESIEISGEYVSGAYGTDSKEFDAWNKITTELYSALIEYRNMMRKL